MTFPFGIFKDKKSRQGRYSRAKRNPIAELKYDEGDGDIPYESHLDMLDDSSVREKFEVCWQEKITVDKDLYEKEGLQLWAIPQSHMDIAWLWRMYQIINKSRITHGKAAFHVLNLPEFKFTFSQPIMLDWLERVFPETFKEVKEAVASGRFELQGGDWVESDAKVPSGESFCRQRLYGQRYYLEKFGKMANVGWLPDSFGYNNNIPQILQKSGCKYFYTQKISGNWPPHAFPFIHFKWRSPSGHEVITYSNNFQFRPITRWHLFGEYRKLVKEGEQLICDYTHPDPASDPALDGVWPHVGIMFGQGDGGHGPTCEEVHRMRYFIQKGYVKDFLTASEYFSMYDEIEHRLPVWNGAELYYNLHRGTLTTQGLMKRMNRYFEWKLAGLQSLFTLKDFLTGRNSNSIHEILTRLWKDTLLLQFHDILPGSSITEVYDDCYDIWTDNMKSIRKLELELFEDYGREDEIEPDQNTTFIIFNPSSHQGKLLVKMNIDNEFDMSPYHSIECADESKVSFQILESDDLNEPFISRPRRLICVLNLDGWGSKNIKLSRDIIQEPEMVVEDNEDEIIIDSDHTTITINRKNGAISSYFDKRLGKEIFTRSSRLDLFRDWFTIERAWNIGPGYKEMPFEEDELVCIGCKVVEEGPVRYSVEIIYHVPESNSSFKQYIQVYADLPGVFFELLIDWNQEEAIAKQYFSFASKPDKIVAEGPYTTEIITADNESRSHLDKQRWECCWHTWLAAPDPEENWGVALLNDCKYGFDIDEDTLGITLIRGPDHPNATGYALEERKGRMDGGPPSHADKGDHLIRYAVLPYEGTIGENAIPQIAHVFNSELISRRKAGSVVIQGNQIKITPGNLELTVLKKPEDKPDSTDTMIARIYETARQEVTGTIK